MSLDLTNADMLDCSPFAGKSNFTAITLNPSQLGSATSTGTSVSTTQTKPVIKPPVLRAKPMLVQKRPPIKEIVVLPTVVQPVSQPVFVEQPLAAPIPVSTAPLGGGVSGGALSGGGESKAQEEGSQEAGVKAVETKDFYKSFWFWGLVAGGVGGYLLAKSKNKNLLAYALVGAGVGGGVGYGAEKMVNKK